MSTRLDNKQWYEKLIKQRGSLNKLDFGKIINGLFLLKHLNEKFQKQREKLLEEERNDELEESDSYLSDNVVYLPEEARWDEILKISKESNLGVCLDNAFEAIKEIDKRFQRVVKKYCFSQSGLQRGNLITLMDEISKNYSDTNSEEEFINNFQELLNGFARETEKVEEGHRHTHLNASKLLVALLDVEQRPANIYDPCFGTASLLLEVAKFIRKTYKGIDENHFSFYGQEKYEDMHSLARINFAINGIEPFLGDPACTFNKEQHKEKKMNYIVASPPSNQEDWRDDESLIDDARWEKYVIPPTNNANYAWILHIIHKLAPSGRAAMLIPQKALHASNDEKRIRQQIIEDDLIEAVILLPKRIVYNDDIQLAVLVINKNKKKRTMVLGDQLMTCRNRTGEICFIDTRKSTGTKIKRDLHLSLENIEKIVKTLHAWRYECLPTPIAEDEIESYKSFSLEEIRKREYSLFQDQYSENNEENGVERQVIDWEEKRGEVEKNLLLLFTEEEEKRKKLFEIFSKKS